jgi:hypothetical protein
MCAADLAWIAQAFKQQNEQSNDIWDGLSKTGQYLNNSEMKRQELEQAQQHNKHNLRWNNRNWLLLKNIKIEPIS